MIEITGGLTEGAIVLRGSAGALRGGTRITPPGSPAASAANGGTAFSSAAAATR